MNNLYLNTYLIIVSLGILHGIFEGFCENILKRKRPESKFDIDILHRFANLEIAEENIFSSCPRNSGKTVYLLFKLIHHLQFNDYVIGIVKNNFHHRIILNMLKPIYEDQGFKIKSYIYHESRLIFEYENEKKVLDFVSENNNEMLKGRYRNIPIIDLVDF